MAKRHFNEPGLLGPIMAELMAQFPLPGSKNYKSGGDGVPLYAGFPDVSKTVGWEKHIAWLVENAAYLATRAVEVRDDFVRGVCEEACCVDDDPRTTSALDE